MNHATELFQRGLIHAIKHAVASWERYLAAQVAAAQTQPAKESPQGESERKAGG